MALKAEWISGSHFNFYVGEERTWESWSDCHLKLCSYIVLAIGSEIKFMLGVCLESLKVARIQSNWIIFGKFLCSESYSCQNSVLST